MLQQCLDPSTRAPLIKLLNDTLTLTHAEALLKHPNFRTLIDSSRVADLQLMHQLLKNVGKQIDLRKEWAGHLKGVSEKILNDEQAIAKFQFKVIENVVKFVKQSEDLISRVFLEKEDSDTFKLALKDALLHSLNINSNQTAEFIAKYLDMHLKKASTSTSLESEQELRLVIDDVIKIFRQVKSKDVFEEFYARSLSRRLLLKKSINREAEQMMITELKAECGDLFTAKVEGMIKDLNLSNEFMQTYKDTKGINDSYILSK